MSTKHARKLACEVIKEQFGDVVEQVCRSLVYRGQQGLQELGRETKLSPPELRACLLVLCQHNCCQAFRPAPDTTSAAPPRTSTQYVALLGAILQRSRFPKMILYARETFGEHVASVVEGLLEHGRLSIEQLLQRASARLSGADEDVSREVSLAIARLVRERLVERSPVPEPILQEHLPDDVAKKGLRGGVRNRAAVEATGYFNSQEQRVVGAAQASDSDRFRLPLSLACLETDDAPATWDGTGVKFPTDAKQDVKAGSKRKRLVLDDDEEEDGRAREPVGSELTSEDKRVLWRVNFDEFIRRFRHQVCVAHMKERFDVASGTIVAAMLDTALSQDSAVHSPETVPMTAEAVLDVLQRSGRREGESLSFDRVCACLQAMAADTEGLVVRSSDILGKFTYSIQLTKIIQLLRVREVETVVAHRYGAAARRIFRLLMMKQHLEQKQIGEMAMIPLKDSRELLYTLLRENFVEIQEISKTADHAPSRTFYLWRVNLPQVLERVLDSMFKGGSNLRQRLAHELAQEQEVLALLEQVQQHMTSGSVSGTQAVSLTEGQKNQLKRIRQVAAVLEASLLRLDDAIMLFFDF